MRHLALLLPAALLAVPAAAQTSPASARTQVERYYAAIDRGDFRTAYSLWGSETSFNFEEESLACLDAANAPIRLSQIVGQASQVNRR